MRHLVIGAGVTGDATGHMLESIGENVYYYDVDKSKLEGRKTMEEAILYDIYWICTAEWNTESVLKKLSGTNKLVVIRSTVPPGFTDRVRKKYNFWHIAHCPEFLREISAREDALKPDRVVIGTNDALIANILCEIFRRITTTLFVTTSTESELIKLMSNAYLSTQISFWNEMNEICKQYKVRTNAVIWSCKADHRVGCYGTDPTRGKFGGFCLPKDLVALIKASHNHRLLKAVKRVNDEL